MRNFWTALSDWLARDPVPLPEPLPPEPTPSERIAADVQALVRHEILAEREACARAAEALSPSGWGYGAEIAAAIRRRPLP
jgi:hypothetical protein